MIKDYKNYLKLYETNNNSSILDFRKKINLKLHEFSRDKYFLIHKLGLQKIIDNFLKPITTTIDGNSLEKYQYPLSLLYKTGKFINVKKVNDRYYCPYLITNSVLEGGHWSYLNKINTNTYALINILTDYFTQIYELQYNMKTEKFMIEIENLPGLYINDFTRLSKKYIIEGDSIDNSMSLKTYLEKYYPNKYDLSKYTDVIKKNSEKGQVSEIIASNFLESKNAKVLYRGGNGDLIDMIFGVDLIIEKNNKILTVQVKSYSIEKLTLEERMRYEKIDIFIGIDSNGKITMLYNNKLYKY